MLRSDAAAAMASRVSCNELLVQQLVLACSAAVRKELALLQLGLSQRCAGGSYRDLRGYGRAIAMQIGCCALPLGLARLRVLHKKNHHPFREVVPRRTEASQKGNHQREQRLHQNSASLAIASPSRRLRPGRSRAGRESKHELTRAIARCPAAAHKPQGQPSHDEPHLR